MPMRYSSSGLCLPHPLIVRRRQVAHRRLKQPEARALARRLQLIVQLEVTARVPRAPEEPHRRLARPRALGLLVQLGPVLGVLGDAVEDRVDRLDRLGERVGRGVRRVRRIAPNCAELRADLTSLSPSRRRRTRLGRRRASARERPSAVVVPRRAPHVGQRVVARQRAHERSSGSTARGDLGSGCGSGAPVSRRARPTTGA